MSLFLGIDTSNYTTSAALYDSEYGTMLSEKKLLPVKKGEAGLRQSDAVFHHTKQLPEIFCSLFGRYGRKADISAIGVSCRPRSIIGSYMPCFLCGETAADCIGAAGSIPVMKTSHQTGHILAALFCADKLSFIKAPFIAFHVSGGTTDCLFCEPDETELIKVTEISSSLDLKAGQLIDRAGLMLGLSFPCGAELERLSERAVKTVGAKAVIRNGSCCLSGFENKVSRLLSEGAGRETAARYVLDAVFESVYEMTLFARNKYGSIPVIFAGGVMSDKYICSKLAERLEGVYFSEPEYSCDNAAGTALYAYLSTKGKF